MNLFTSKYGTVSIEKNWCRENNQSYLEFINEDSCCIYVDEIDAMIAALEFAKSETVVERTKELVAQCYDLELADVVSIEIKTIGDNIEGYVDVHSAGQAPRFVEFKVPRLV